VVVDQEQGPEFDQIVSGSLGFRSNDTVEYLAFRNLALYRITQNL